MATRRPALLLVLAAVSCVGVLGYTNVLAIARGGTGGSTAAEARASLGSSSSLTLLGGHASAFVDGEAAPVRDPFSAKNFNVSAGATEYVALAIRVRGEFASALNLRQLFAASVVVACETTNRILLVRCVLNPTMSGNINWSYVNQSRSAVEYTTPTTIAPSGGQEVASTVTGTTVSIDLSALALRLEPGDVVAICIATGSSTATAGVAINWQER